MWAALYVAIGYIDRTSVPEPLHNRICALWGTPKSYPQHRRICSAAHFAKALYCSLIYYKTNEAFCTRSD